MPPTEPQRASPARPILGLTAGDPAGVGPELVRRALADAGLRERARLIAFGPAALCPAGTERVDAEHGGPLPASGDPLWVETPGPERWEMGAVQAACGRAAVEALRAGHEWATRGAVDALVTAPVSKEAMHLAGERVEGQTQLLSSWSGRPVEMMATAGQLRVLLLTRHLALREALGRITRDGVVRHLMLFAEALSEWGWERPRLALAGLNPHAGEDCLFGDEEVRTLTPAVEAARRAGLDVSGPISADVVFRDASRGKYDGVLALYHDQAFIPVKLLAPESALTVLVGLPYLRISPAHGTAFDIAGQGIASPQNLFEALREAARWVERRCRSAG